MEVMPLMSGAKGEEAHHLYKEEDGSHRCIMFMFLIFQIYGLFRLVALFICLAKIVVLFSTGCSRVGIPPLSLRSLKGRVLHYIPQLGIWPSSVSYTT